VIRKIGKRDKPSVLAEVLDFACFLQAKRQQELSLAETKAKQDELGYEQAKAKALAMISTGFALGGQGIENRDALHDRRICSMDKLSAL
jgi:hypothetical protein